MRQRGLGWIVVSVLAVSMSACRDTRAGASAPDSARPLSGSIGDPASLQLDDGQWVMPAKNYASTRFSSLNEITTANVSRLRVAWTFATGMVAGHEAAPLVVGTTMYPVVYRAMLYVFSPGGGS